MRCHVPADDCPFERRPDAFRFVLKIKGSAAHKRRYSKLPSQHPVLRCAEFPVQAAYYQRFGRHKYCVVLVRTSNR